MWRACRALTTGQVIRVAVHEGDRVNVGDLLAEIDSEDLRAERDRRVAERDALQATADDRAARDRVAAASAAVREATLALDRARITAPIAGTVLSRHVDPGDTVSEGVSLGVPLFEVADLDHRSLRIEVDAEAAANVGIGDAVVVTAPGGVQVLARGTVERMSPQLEPRTIGLDDARTRASSRVRSLWLTLPANDVVFTVGRVLEATVITATPTRTRVPRAAVRVIDGKAVVDTPFALWTRPRSVDLGAVDPEWAEVQGIAEGASVRLH